MGLSTGNRNMTATTDVPGSAQGCGNGAFMDSFGIFLQGLLAVMAFSILMCEYSQCVCSIVLGRDGQLLTFSVLTRKFPCWVDRTFLLYMEEVSLCYRSFTKLKQHSGCIIVHKELPFDQPCDRRHSSPISVRCHNSHVIT